MSRKKLQRPLFSLLSLVSIFTGLVVYPQVSGAAMAISEPAANLYIEFVDKQGNEIPISMGIEGRYVSTYGVSKVTTILNDDPLSITKTSGKNQFVIQVPAFNHASSISYEVFYNFMADLKMNTPLPYVKEMGISPTGISGPVIGDITEKAYYENNPTIVKGRLVSNYIKVKRNLDDTYNFIDDNGGGSFGIRVFEVVWK